MQRRLNMNALMMALAVALDLGDAARAASLRALMVAAASG